jgi:hypothetical protein
MSSIITGDPKRGKILTVVARGVGILARPQSGGKPGIMGAIYLTSIYGVADNKGLFWGVPGKSPRLNQFGLSMASKETLVAEVFA